VKRRRISVLRQLHADGGKALPARPTPAELEDTELKELRFQQQKRKRHLWRAHAEGLLLDDECTPHVEAEALKAAAEKAKDAAARKAQRQRRLQVSQWRGPGDITGESVFIEAGLRDDVALRRAVTARGARVTDAWYKATLYCVQNTGDTQGLPVKIIGPRPCVVAPF
jgi:hypothetical protein